MQGEAAGWCLEPGLGARTLVREGLGPAEQQKEQNWREQPTEQEEAQGRRAACGYLAWAGQAGGGGLRKQFQLIDSHCFLSEVEEGSIGGWEERDE